MALSGTAAVLFNSVEFIFVFLPVALGAFWALLRVGNRAAALWLLACSLFFYGWWSPRHVVLLLLSVAFNYAVGLALCRASAGPRRRLLLAAGVAGDLLLLAVFKYADFLLHSLWIAGLLALAWFAPNTQEIMARHLPQMRRATAGRGLLLWRPTAWHAALLGLAAVVALGHLANVSEFLYFQF